jgi:hypothetical protein
MMMAVVASSPLGPTLLKPLGSAAGAGGAGGGSTHERMVSFL